MQTATELDDDDEEDENQNKYTLYFTLRIMTRGYVHEFVIMTDVTHVEMTLLSLEK